MWQSQFVRELAAPTWTEQASFFFEDLEHTTLEVAVLGKRAHCHEHEEIGVIRISLREFAPDSGFQGKSYDLPKGGKLSLSIGLVLDKGDRGSAPKRAISGSSESSSGRRPAVKAIDLLPGKEAEHPARSVGEGESYSEEADGKKGKKKKHKKKDKKKN
jgi:hypothetical protein